MEDVAQVAGVDALGLINLIVAAARNATTHRHNCEHLAAHVRMVGNLLEKLKSTDLRTFPATGEPLDLLEEALRKALDLVESCREKSYLYMLAMGWSVVYQFRRVQNQIDRYLKLVPLISLVHEYRMQEYPELEFHEALQEEKEKLHVELHRSIVKNDPKECQVIEHLIEVTENVVNVPTGKKLSLDVLTYSGSGYGTTTKSSDGANDLKPKNQVKSEWQTDLFDCCSLKACIYPCGIFSRIAHVSSKGNTLGGACDDFLTHLMCCCCAMVQEWRELEMRGFEGYPGRNMIPPPYQYMKP
ncbi:unnamed protein product [Camellia sinensis]